MASVFNNNTYGNQRTLRPGGNQPLMQMQGMVNRLQPNRNFMNNMNARMTQTLNRPLDRMRNDAAGVSNAINPSMLNPANPNSYVPSGQVSGGLSPRQNTQMARNVMMGQSPYADTSMRPLNIPGMTMQGNRMVQMSPYETRGVTPGSMSKVQAALEYDNPDDYRVATGGKAMVPYEPSTGPSQTGINSSTSAARMARMRRTNPMFARFMQMQNANRTSPATSAGAETMMSVGMGNFGGRSQPVQNQAVAVPSQFVQSWTANPEQQKAINQILTPGYIHSIEGNRYGRR